MSRIEQEEPIWEKEKPRSVGELLYARNVLELDVPNKQVLSSKSLEELAKEVLSSKSPEELTQEYTDEDTNKVIIYFTHKKALGQDQALNYALGRTVDLELDHGEVPIAESDLTNPPPLRSIENITAARDLTDKRQRETYTEVYIHRANYDGETQGNEAQIEKLGKDLKTIGKIEGIRYVLSEDNSLFTLVEEAKRNNQLPIKYPHTP